jgi:hypothetical protein
MFQYALISFCNSPSQSPSPVLLVKLSPDLSTVLNFTPIYLGLNQPTLQVTGITSNENSIFVIFVLMNKQTYISSLSIEDFSLRFCQELPEIIDPHSIVTINNQLFIVSTGTDEVVRYDYFDGGLSNRSIFWRASEAKSDTHHINSIAKNSGELYISAFGPKSGQLWSTAENGYIHNISKDVRVMDKIYHPHSLTIIKNQFFYCESFTGSLMKNGNQIVKVDGYTRGIASPNENFICIGTSIGRKISKSTGLINQAIEGIGEPTGFCGVNVFNTDLNKITINHDFSWFGPEIYEIHFITLLKDIVDFDFSFLFANAYLVEQEIIKKYKEKIQEQNRLIEEKDNKINKMVNSRSWKFALKFSNIYNLFIKKDKS